MDIRYEQIRTFFMVNSDNKSKKAADACLDINATSILLGLSLVNKAKVHLKKPLKRANLTLTQWLVLKIIYLKRANTPSSVSKTIDADPTTITRHLDNLEKRGLIVRQHDREDRRVIQIKITDKGTEVAEDLYQSYTGIMHNIETYITEKDLVIWRKVEKCVHEHINEISK